MKFENYLDSVIKKASNKINTLSRVTPFMNMSKKKMSMNSFFKSQFSYCPLIWMCHSRTINNKISYLQERCLRVIYNDKISSFKELLERNKSHCVKSVQIRSFFWSSHSDWMYLSVFNPNAAKDGPEKTPYLDTFHTVSVPIHNWNLQMLATEMFKVYNNIAPPIFTEIFYKRNPNYQHYATLHSFQFHLLKVYIMELKAYHS